MCIRNRNTFGVSNWNKRNTKTLGFSGEENEKAIELFFGFSNYQDSCESWCFKHCCSKLSEESVFLS